jgi:multiple sugar transport system substrate-binding protein
MLALSSSAYTQMYQIHLDGVLGLVVIVSGWWITSRSSVAQPEDGVIDLWTMWAEDPGQLQALLDRYGQVSGLAVKVTTDVDEEKVSKGLAGPIPPDLVILSSNDLVGSYYHQDLVEPLNGWIEATDIDVDDINPAPLAQCETPGGDYACLPWGCDVFALVWKKDAFASVGLDPECPPQTLEELVAFADKLTLRDEDGELGKVGFTPDFSRSHTELYARVFGGSWTGDGGTELTVNSGPMIDAADWQLRFYDTPDLRAFVSSLDRYMESSHPHYAGRRLSCQQCHRASSPISRKAPDRAFYDGKVAMMVAGQWQVWPDRVHAQPELDYGVAPFPPPADHPEWANTAVVEGPVVVIPAGAKDREAAADLLAWMMSPEIVAEAAYTHASLPTSRQAAQDPRFRQIPGLEVFLALMAHPNARGAVTTPIDPELNEALGRVEEQLLHGRGGGVPMLLLNEVQAQLSAKLRDVAAYHDWR